MQQRFKISPDDLKEIQASKGKPDVKLAVWAALGKRMGFDPATVRWISDRSFMAVKEQTNEK
jgi:hypothetical protein